VELRNSLLDQTGRATEFLPHGTNMLVTINNINKHTDGNMDAANINTA
jgi:hypothetical protein